MSLVIANFTNQFLQENTSLDIFSQLDYDITKVYGVEFLDYKLQRSNYKSVSTNRTGVRLYGAENLNFEPASNDYAGVDDFKTKDVFNIKECCTRYDEDLESQVVVSYKGDPTWETDKVNPDYNVMLEFPLFYYYRPNPYCFMVCKYKYNDKFKPSPMHSRPNGYIYDKVYVSKYKINTNFRSVANTTIHKSISDGISDYAAAVEGTIAQGLYLMDYTVYSSITMLMLIKYATLHAGPLFSNTDKNMCGYSKDYNADGKYSDCSVMLGLEDWLGSYQTCIHGLIKQYTTTTNQSIVVLPAENFTNTTPTIDATNWLFTYENFNAAEVSMATYNRNYRAVGLSLNSLTPDYNLLYFDTMSSTTSTRDSLAVYPGCIVNVASHASGIKYICFALGYDKAILGTNSSGTVASSCGFFTINNYAYYATTFDLKVTSGAKEIGPTTYRAFFYKDPINIIIGEDEDD